MSARTKGEAEAVLSDMGSWVNDHAIPDQRRNNRRGCADRAVASDADFWPYDRVGADDRARADFGAAANHRARVDDHTGLQSCGRMDDGRSARRRSR